MINMITISSNIKNRVVGQSILTLVDCLKIYKNDGTVVAFTTHTQSIRFKEEPQIIYSCLGFSPSALSSANDMSVSNVSGSMIIDNELLSEDDLEKNLFDNAYYEFFMVDWTLKTKGFYSYADIIKRTNGTIGEITRQKNQFSAEFRSLEQYLATTIVDLIKVECNAQLGDSRCKLDLTPYTFNDSIASFTKQSSFVVNSTSVSGFTFTNGQVKFLTGQNANRSYTIKSWDNDTKIVTLQIPANYPIAVGDTIQLIAGCGKYKTDCLGFNNYINYRGFYDIPGLDFIVSGGGTQVEQDTSS